MVKTTSLVLFALAVSLVAICTHSSRAEWIENGIPICTDTGLQQDLQLAAVAGGGAVIVYEDDRDDIGDIYVQRLSSGGIVSWATDGVPVCSAGDHQYSPQIIADGSGGAIITWADQRSGLADIYAQRISAAGAMLWDVNGVAICDTSMSQDGPQLVSDGSGGAIITWHDYRSTVDAGIFAQRVDPNGNVLWTSSGVTICRETGNQLDPQIISDGAGGAIITWTDYRYGNDDIFAARVDADGTPLWTTNGVPICTAMGGQEDPQIISDGAEGAIFTWMDYRSGAYDIYANRVDGTGTPLWTADGVAICTAASKQEDPKLVSDGAGGAIITWEDYRGSVWDVGIYTQRVDTNGTPMWIADGVILCDEWGNQEDPQIVSDDAGGAVIVWHDFRGDLADIYEQRVDASGTPQWTTNGVALCIEEGNQVSPQVTPDGAGGAISAWVDRRVAPSQNDIYAQRVTHDGEVAPVVSVEELPPGKVSLELQAIPNPAVSAGAEIRFSLEEAGHCRLRIFDSSGRLVRELPYTRRPVGKHSLHWDCRDGRGRRVAPGTYFYQVEVNGRKAAQRAL